MLTKLILSLLLTVTLQSQSQPRLAEATVCIIGSGIGGSSVAHFLRQYSHLLPHPDSTLQQIRIFEQNGIVGGRMATVTISGQKFEAGASILHPKNYHALDYAKSLNLTIKKPSSDSLSFGIWDGNKFVFKTFNSNSELPFVKQIVSLVNSVLMFIRYGFSLIRMSSFVENTVNNFLKYYKSFDSRPVFESVEEMLKWAGLYDMTTRTLEEELVQAGLPSLLIRELVSVITRINYGQSVSISGLAGAVSLAGSGGGLWSIEGGNWQMAAGLTKGSDAALHLHEEIESVSYSGDFYELNSTKGKSYKCQVTVVATPLDELNISFIPAISIPMRKLQHTYATFVRGLLNPAYFGLHDVSDIPELVGTIEAPDLLFSSISVLKEHDEKDMTYKIFSRQLMAEELMDKIFSVRNQTIQINWAAYPHYHAPEKFAPFILDNHHLYYVNAFENAASTMETSAVAAENIARLILSRLADHSKQSGLSNLTGSNSDKFPVHSDL